MPAKDKYARIKRDSSGYRNMELNSIPENTDIPLNSCLRWFHGVADVLSKD